MLAALLWACAKLRCETLHVLDFGGSLGSSYFQNRKFIINLDIQWSVVEQEHFVTVGQSEIADDILKFYYTLDEAMHRAPINVALCSNVLQYIEGYQEYLQKIIDCRPELLIVDRLPISNDDSTYITLQRVSSKIYKASYPCRVFSEKMFIKTVHSLGYNLHESFESVILSPFNRFSYKGFVFVRENSSFGMDN
jgi:putative methyltransferase (TIGR04325 family)